MAGYGKAIAPDIESADLYGIYSGVLQYLRILRKRPFALLVLIQLGREARATSRLLSCTVTKLRHKSRLCNNSGLICCF